MAMFTTKRISVLLSLSAFAVACSKNQAPDPGLTQPAAAPAPTAAAAPAAPKTPEQKLDEAIQIALETVYFDFDSAVLTEAAQKNLVSMAEALKINPTVKLGIEGHTDERGSPEYNLHLSEKRAQAIKEFLVASGIPADRLVTSGKGEESPAAQGADEGAFKKNRRGEFRKL